jgi:hypothetical protein
MEITNTYIVQAAGARLQAAGPAGCGPMCITNRGARNTVLAQVLGRASGRNSLCPLCQVGEAWAGCAQDRNSKPVAHATQEEEDLGFKSSPGKVSKTLSQKTNKQKGWGHGSSGRVLA